jgi:hypothetical protein
MSFDSKARRVSMRRLTFFTSVLTLAAAVGCSSSTPSSPASSDTDAGTGGGGGGGGGGSSGGGSGGGGGGSTGGTGTTDAGGSGGGGSVTDAGAGTTTDAGGSGGGGSTVDGGTVTTGIGPIPIAAGEEKTQCITFPLTNADPLYITRITADLMPGSHHLVIYQSTPKSAPQTTPIDCQALGGILTGEKPVMIVEKPHDDLVFPTNVALKFDANQWIKLEAHYINVTSAPLQGSASVSFEGVGPSQSAGIIESNLAFWGTTSISVAANSTGQTQELFQKALAGTKGFALTTHQHHYGTRFQVWAGAQAGDPNKTQIADTTNWADPPLYRLTPELSFDGTNGLSYQCEWNNTSSSTVTFGESALQEMCFLWMYYYPSQGFQTCIDGNCRIK